MSATWRVAEHSEMPLEKLPSFKFTSCKGSEPQEQPPNFRRYKLRPEQQRSLGWMLAQEWIHQSSLLDLNVDLARISSNFTIFAPKFRKNGQIETQIR